MTQAAPQNRNGEKLITKNKRQSRNALLQFLQGSVSRAGMNGEVEYGGGGDRKGYPLVERADQGSVVRLHSRLARLDLGRVRLHRIPADHGAHREGI